MSKTAVYNTTVSWKGEHWGHIVDGKGPEMDILSSTRCARDTGSIHPGRCFCSAANTCIMMSVYLGCRTLQTSSSIL